MLLWLAEGQLKLITIIYLVKQFLPNLSQTMRTAILFSTTSLFQRWSRTKAGPKKPDWLRGALPNRS